MAKMMTPAMEKRMKRQNKHPLKADPWHEAWYRLRRNRTAMVGLFIVAVLLILALFPSVFACYGEGGGAPPVAAEDGGVYLQLGGHGLLNRELGGRLFIELFPQAAAQFIVIAQGGQIVAQGLPVAGLEEIAVHVLVDEIGS